MALGGWVLRLMGLCLINCREAAGQDSHAGTHQESGSRNYDSPQDLLARLMFSYHPSVMPRTPVNVSYGLDVLNIDGVDERQGVLRIAAFSCMNWVDRRLSWDPAMFRGIQRVRLASKRIWQPGIRLYTQVLQEEDANILLHSNGTIYYIRPVRITLSCVMQFANYPYGSHNCSLIVESWIYDETMVDLDINAGEWESFVTLGRFRPHGSWTLVPLAAKRIVSYDQYGTGHSRLEFILKLKRTPTDYGVRVLAPSVATSVLLLSCFLIPPAASGYRIVFCCMLLLCCLVQLLSLNLTVPLTGPDAPFLGDFLCFSVFLALFAVVESVVSVNLSQCIRKDGDSTWKDEGVGVELSGNWNGIKARIARIIDAVSFIVFTLIFAIGGGVLLNHRTE